MSNIQITIGAGVTAGAVRQGGGPIARIGQRIAGGIRAVIHRCQAVALQDLTARELYDIGLTPADVRIARRTPLLEDPTEALILMAAERQRDEAGIRRR